MTKKEKQRLVTIALQLRQIAVKPNSLLYVANITKMRRMIRKEANSLLIMVNEAK